MESIYNDKIAKISDDLIELLKANNEKHWSTVLQNIRNEYINCDLATRKKIASEFIIAMRGGMGSFLDLVLHKDRKPLIDENNRLDVLRHQLYEECKKLTVR